MEKVFPFLILIASVACYASLTPLNKKIAQTLPPGVVITGTMFVLFALALVFSLTTERNKWSVHDLTKETVLIVLLSATINFLGFYLAIKAYPHFPVWQQSLFQLLVPIFASFLAIFLLSEPWNPKLLLGLSIMAVGLYVTVR